MRACAASARSSEPRQEPTDGRPEQQPPQRDDHRQARAGDGSQHPQRRTEQRPEDGRHGHRPGVHLERATDELEVCGGLLVRERGRLRSLDQPATDRQRQRRIAPFGGHEHRSPATHGVELIEGGAQRPRRRPNRRGQRPHATGEHAGEGDDQQHHVSSLIDKKRAGRSKRVSFAIHQPPIAKQATTKPNTS